MIRCSSIHAIMTNPQKKADEWSKTAESSMLEQAREKLFNVRKNIDDVDCIRKGKACEDDGVELYNNVFLFDLKKLPADSRRNNGVITGEPDIIATGANKGVDIKCAWSLLTFPLFASMAAKKEYEWQARGYMCLFDVDVWEIAYCMIDTPEELLKPWHNIEEHRVDPSIPLHHRITIARYERDMDIEKTMLAKCAKANDWVDHAVKEFATNHDQYIK